MPMAAVPGHPVPTTASITRPSRMILVTYVANPTGSTSRGLTESAQAITALDTR